MSGLAQERAAAAGQPAEAAAIIPVVYSMSPSELESPLSSFQVYPGDQGDRVAEVCVRPAKEAGFPKPRPEFRGPGLDKHVPAVTAHRPRRARTLDDMAP
jgi:hypothetical protein